MNVAAVADVRKDFTTASGVTVAALRGVTVGVDAGELLTVVGRSGSGKTTLLQVLGTLERPTAGEVTILGTPVQALSDDDLAATRCWSIGFVFQAFCLIDTMTAAQNVEAGLIYRGVPAPVRRDMAAAALAAVGLQDRAGHLPAELSGGERQRVAIARATIGERALLIADEPTGNLDSATAAGIWRTLRHIADSGVAVVVATHDAGAGTIADRQVNLHDGTIQPA